MINDDPFGLLQLSAFILTTEYFNAPSNSARTLHSVYTHTWQQIEINTFITYANESISQTHYSIALPNSCKLIIKPETDNKAWFLPSTVTFNF